MDPNVQAILASVQAFYSTAWSQLVVYTTALLALVGILVPVLSQWYQRKSAAVDKKELEGLLRDQVDHAREDLRTSLEEQANQLRKSFEIEIANLRAEATRASQAARGGAYHVQAVGLLKEEQYPNTLESLIYAARCYVEARDENNLGRVLDMMHMTVLPHLSKDDLAQLLVAHDILKDLVDLLREHNYQGRYTDHITAISRARLQAENRDGPPRPAQ